MSKLPINWATTNAIEIAEPIRGVTYKKEQARDSAGNGLTALLRANNIQRDQLELSELVYVPNGNVSSNQLLRKNDVVIAMSSGSISVVGKSAQLKTDLNASFGAFCGVLRPSQEIEPRYLGHFLKSDAYRQGISDLARGVNINNLKWSHFEEISLPLAPLPEQKRIADKLDSVLARVDACRDRLDRLPALLKRFRQSILAAATSGRLTEDWNAQEKPTWTTVRLNDIGEFGRGKSKHRPRNDPRLYGGNYPFVQTGDVASAKGEITSHSQTYNDFGLAQSKLWPAGTLCITIAANIADTAILAYPACFPDSIVGFAADQKLCNVHFVKWVIDVTKEDLERFAPATAQKNINLGVLSEVSFKLPSLEEQHEIVRRVEILFAFADRLEARLRTARQQVEQLTPALLAKAFRGELVPQDPADEPASELLKRLAAARADAPKPKRGRSAARQESPTP